MLVMLLIFALLLVNSLKDIKKGEISLPSVIGFAAIGIGRAACLGRITTEYFAALGIGGTVILVSVVTRGAIGIGDGLILLALGTVMTWQELGCVFMSGILCCCICSAIILLLPGKNRKTQIPFVPFLLVGYVGGLIF